MSQYHFDINFGDGNDGYDGPPCPRVVECDRCKRIMEAPLLADEKPKRCCLNALKRALQAWLKDDYAPHMDPSPLDMAMAALSLDALMWDMERTHSEEFLEDHPEIIEERDKFLNKSIAHRLRQNGFNVHIKKDGTIVGMGQLSEMDDEGNCDMLELEIEELRSSKREDPGSGKKSAEAWGLGPIGPISEELDTDPWVEEFDIDPKDWI